LVDMAVDGIWVSYQSYLWYDLDMTAAVVTFCGLGNAPLLP
jgi:hypothetical protein